MEQRPPAQPATDQEGEESAEQENERSYHTLYKGKDMAFDPMKDLKLPTDYDEVLARYRKLRGVRPPELN